MRTVITETSVNYPETLHNLYARHSVDLELVGVHGYSPHSKGLGSCGDQADSREDG